MDAFQPQTDLDAAAKRAALEAELKAMPTDDLELLLRILKGLNGDGSKITPPAGGQP